ncbi:MAG: DUF2974 domain-containing protein [Erysipelotrichaceae bacterium]|nr:DUF2974 domain-containing protein [Erysipelotrichaceae bacterium]
MNIIDYLKWRGDLSFKADPYNEVDSLVISQFIYAEMQDVLKPEDRITVKELSERFFAKHSMLDVVKNKPFGIHGIVTLDEMARSARFKDCVVYNYSFKLHADTTEQFAALMMDLPDNTTVVCFKGTDETLIGWKENCYLSYKDIAGQADAKDYVDRYCSIFHKYRFIGHSKGGNLAIYAAVHCKPLLRQAIIQIVSADGPGLRPGSYDEKVFEKLKDRYQLIVPERDGVGTIYEMTPHRTIVKTSTGNLIEAHGQTNWEVFQNRLVRADTERYETDVTRRSIKKFLQDTTPNQRQIFVEETFKALAEANIKTVYQLSQGGLPILFKVIKRLSEMDSDAKGIAGAMFRSITENINSDLSKAFRRRAGALKLKAGSLIEEHNPFTSRKKNKEDEVTEEETVIEEGDK